MAAEHAPLIVQPIFEFENLTINQQAEVILRTRRFAQPFSEFLSKGVLLDLVSIPGGTFYMGSADASQFADEVPLHAVMLPPFRMAKCLVTQGQWKTVMGRSLTCRFKGADLPVDNVSWPAAREFCAKLSKLTGRAYHLPSEAQWEYACRAGTATPFYCGETITTEFANYCGEHVFLHEPRGIYRHTSTSGGSLPPNPFGLYDMSGNLWEWCADVWHENYRGAPITGGAWETDGDPAYRVARGGSWHDTPELCRSATRLKVDPKTGDDLIGFRVVLSAGLPEKV
jgi:formylglycine-generating enzyme required for sulfatase activity